MEEERIKSALEIAMERISRMPEMTPEEIAAQKEKECGPIGLALSKRFLEGGILEGELNSELKKCTGEQVPTVRRILIDNLCRSIQLDDREKSFRALGGIRELFSGKGSVYESAARDLEQILAGYDQEKAKRSGTFQALEVERLRDLGISGTAVRPNLIESPVWQQELQKVREEFEPRLAHIRKVLADF